ncbi:MAG TPA: response regulator [Patescibacteria group bacterium]|nr:response regulator [Patescibacteria group bacterium]
MSYVLLLEPNTLLAATYAQALTHAGHTVMTAHHAQEAIYAADKQAPEVVIMELQLGGHNGVEFLHEFRSYAEWQHVPVIINTSLPPVRMQAIEQVLRVDLGVVQIFYKPAAALVDLCRAASAQTANSA